MINLFFRAKLMSMWTLMHWFEYYKLSILVNHILHHLRLISITRTGLKPTRLIFHFIIFFIFS